MRIRVAMDDGTASTPWLTVHANGIEQLPFAGPGGTAPDTLSEEPPEPTPNPPPPPEDSLLAAGSASAASPGEPRTPLGLRVLGGTPLGVGPAIAFELPAPSEARVVIFDLQGRKRRTLADRGFAAGAQVLPWDGRDATGARAARGLYFVRVSTRARTATARVWLEP